MNKDTEYVIEPIDESHEVKPEDQTVLTEEMHETAKEIEVELTKSNSFIRRFFLGIFSGFGTVVGATILVALTVYILTILAQHGIWSGFSEWLISRLQGKGN